MSTQPSYTSPPTSQLAIASLVLGLLSYIMLPILGAIGAIITGHMARRELRESRGSMSGDGLALAGLILGYAHIALVVIGVLVFVLFLGGLAALLAYAH